MPAWCRRSRGKRCETRRRHANRYTRLLTEAGLLGRVALPVVGEGNRHVFHHYVIRVADRDALRMHLTKAGIGSDVYYPTPLHLQPCFADLGYRRGDVPRAEQAASESLALPLYPELTEAQLADCVHAIRSWHTPQHLTR